MHRCAQDRDGAAALLDGGKMRRGIDASRQSAYDCDAMGDQRPRKFPGSLQRGPGSLPGTHDGNSSTGPQEPFVSDHVQLLRSMLSLCFVQGTEEILGSELNHFRGSDPGSDLAELRRPGPHFVSGTQRGTGCHCKVAGHRRQHLATYPIPAQSVAQRALHHLPVSGAGRSATPQGREIPPGNSIPARSNRSGARKERLARKHVGGSNGRDRRCKRCEPRILGLAE